MSWNLVHQSFQQNDVQTVQSSLIWVYTVCHSTKYFKKHLHEKQNLSQKGME